MATSSYSSREGKWEEFSDIPSTTYFPARSLSPLGFHNLPKCDRMGPEQMPDGRCDFILRPSISNS